MASASNVVDSTPTSDVSFMGASPVTTKIPSVPSRESPWPNCTA